MTDPISDMLTRVRNANVAMHDKVVMPSSKLKEALAKILVQEGYISGFAVRDNTKSQILKAFEKRLGNDRETEFSTACKQVERIAELRLRAMLPE